MPSFIRHDYLIQRMQELGYCSNSLGICYGIAHMGMQAMLIDEINQFDNRLQKIAAIPLDNLKKHPDLTTEILPFFDGVELYQQPEIYPYLFEKNKVPKQQNALLISPVVLSEKVQKKGGICKVKLSCGVYTLNELNDYLDLIMSHIIAKNAAPLVLMIHFSNHSTAIGYDPKKHQWLLIDANQLPSKKFSKNETKALAEHLFYALNTPKTHRIIIAAELYRIKSDEKRLRQLVHNISQNKTWIQLHAVTLDKDKFVDHKGVSWLNIAARCGYFEQVKELIAIGTKVINQVANDGRTPLFEAAQNGYVEIVKLLIANGAKVNSAANYNITPLLMASQNGYGEIVKDLLAQGADANQASSYNGTTPLLMAAQYGYIKIAKKLLAHGADVNKAANNGATPLLMAAENGHIEIVKKLLAHGANVNKAANNGVTPLLMAVLNGHVEIVKNLLENGAKVNKAAKGVTPLFMAVQKGYLDIVEILLANKANISMHFKRPVNSLRQWAREYSANVAKSMEELFIKKNATEELFISPLDIATVMGHTDIITLLKNASMKSCNFSKSVFFSKNDKLPIEQKDSISENLYKEGESLFHCH